MSSETFSAPLQTHAFGIHTLVHNISPVPEKPNEVDVILGTEIVRWDVKAQKRVRTVPAHNTLIKYIKKSHCSKFKASIADDGEIKIWNQNFEVLAHGQAPDPPTAKIWWSPCSSMLLTVSKGAFEFKTAVVVLWKFDAEEKTLVKMKQIQGYYRMAIFNANNQIIVWQCGDPCSLILFSLDFDVLSERKYGEVNFAEGFALNKDRLACAKRDHKIVISNAENLEVLSEFQTVSTGQLWSLLWKGDDIVLSKKSGHFSVWDSKTGTLKYDFRGPSEFIFSIILTSPDTLGIASQSGLHVMPYPKDGSAEVHIPRMDIGYHKITCCGVDFSPDGKYVACGDLACQVMVWDVSSCVMSSDESKSDEIEKLSLSPRVGTSPIAIGSVGMMVRSLCWKSDQELIVIGCLDGSVWEWSPNLAIDEPSEPKFSFQLEGGVTSLQWSHTSNEEHPPTLACGTTSGQLTLMEYDGTKFQQTLTLVAHSPVHSDDPAFRENFGSLHKNADLWSLIWSPDHNFLATASEDQTTVIRKRTGEKLKTLTGHTSAVTCVDWAIVDLQESPRELLATCADDRKIMVWDPKDWSLYTTFESQSIYGWYTITYLKFEPNGCRLVCGTENGFLMVFDVSSKEQIWCGRVHSGSIEGLEWNSFTGCIATCSADSTIMIHQLSDYLTSGNKL